MIQKTFHLTYRTAKRIAIAVVGGTMVILGVIMIVTPGPGLLGIVVGLTILAIEFAWARRWLKRLRVTISNGMANNRAKRAENHRDRAQD